MVSDKLFSQVSNSRVETPGLTTLAISASVALTKRLAFEEQTPYFDALVFR